MKKIIFLVGLLVASSVLAEQLTTYDKAFEEKFTLEHLKDGDKKTYPKERDTVHVHYTGTLKDGTKFDSSIDRGQPLSFTLGVGQVIKCWDMVVARLSLGEKVKVVCPSELAYGSRGAGRIIKPNTDLVFEMELMQIGNSNHDL